MTDPALVRLRPAPGASGLDDTELAALYTAGTGAGPSWLRVNFVASLDGAATEQGLSGGLSDDADKRVFDILRRLCDVVVVGAGTIRAEGYGAMRVDAASQRARRADGLTEHPVFAIVSAVLDLDPAGPIFREAPERPLVLTSERSRAGAREALAEVADVVVCGAQRVEPRLLVRELAARGLRRIHCEGGPRLFGDLLAGGVVDELCLTLSPRLEAGSATRIAVGAAPIEPVGMRLAHVLHSEDTLLLRYVRAGAAA
ncbi:hypothetical protein ATY41_01305 [Leifsonia xyli subsp. xyli]|uniref:Bacterial bifunctional deaminase-reductase C-terminal domain-containing protein n=1 Tax=Leifsonia xyli subsp. xyli TaxID=59736 RepID=A0A1E2SNN2_LEIXY|nr:pyrimidine reductase family protein [Leifsonia xyli]ODA91347.1 hypothetical protein ATY41_01305 [Leifsonia xyli subsp. xyli]